ncbi:hypothetical protein [Micromonospora sediminicola]|uniref:hypothetical protein n=1 Tax=Micromonospora sediminicola TaxID=946078 RepID=UPI0037B238A0
MTGRPTPVPPPSAAPRPRRLLARLKALPLPGFVLVHLALYCAFLGIGTVVGYRRLANDPSVEGFVVEATLAAAYIGLASVLPFAVALGVLFLFRDVGPSASGRPPWCCAACPPSARPNRGNSPTTCRSRCWWRCWSDSRTTRTGIGWGSITRGPGRAPHRRSAAHPVDEMLIHSRFAKRRQED